MNFKSQESHKKLRGGYYTPGLVASFLAAWVLRGQRRKILEPGCGDGVFIDAISQLAKDNPEITDITLDGIEADKHEAQKSRARLKNRVFSEDASVRTTDFFEAALFELDEQSYDGVVGNPPFIRYQYMEPEQQERARLLFERENLHFTKHTNAWVSFLLGSLRALRPGGRLGFVVPTELLHVIHARSVRQYLLAKCSDLIIVDVQEVFEKTLQGTVLLLAEKKEVSSNIRANIAVRQIQNWHEIKKPVEYTVDYAEVADDIDLDYKWMSIYLSHRQRQLLRELEGDRTLVRFHQIADVDVGIVTGANKYFLVPDETVERYGLHDFAYPMFGRSEHARGAIYTEDDHEENRRRGYPANFLYIPGYLNGSMPKQVQEYIALGEKQQIHTRFKCRVRSPWYTVPSVWAADIGMLKRCHNFPKVILNRAGAYTTDTAYRIQMKQDGDVDSASLAARFVNSITALSAELEGRHYGGGVLELVPSEIERLLIPKIGRGDLDLHGLDRMLRNDRPAAELLRERDAVVLSQAGISRDDQIALHEAWQTLKARRQREKVLEENREEPLTSEVTVEQTVAT